MFDARITPDQPPDSPLCCRTARGLLAQSLSATDDDLPELTALDQWRREDPGLDPLQAWLAGIEAAAATTALDRALVGLAGALGLTLAEVLAVAIAFDAEHDPTAGRLLAFLQEPLGGARPTLGLLARAFARAGVPCSVEALASSRAVRSGLLGLSEPGAPLPERAVVLPEHLFFALTGRPVQLAGVSASDSERDRLPLAASIERAAARHAEGIRRGGSLVVRSGDPIEARAVAAAIARELGGEPLFIEAELPPGLVPWLHLGHFIPVIARRLAPGERLRLPALEGWSGPLLVASGLDGAVEASGGNVLSFRVEVPPAAERMQLWAAALGGTPLARELGNLHRHGCGRIAELGRLSRQHAAMDRREMPDRTDVLAAAWQGDGQLETLAQPIRERVTDDALVLPGSLRRELELLVSRCRQREGLLDGLGAATATRYRSGVRALLVGPSGTGKTLVASWLASRLAMPLYRVDLAAVVSKYIGETEKNLAELLARAECSDVILFFDEADALFGKRTDVEHSNDRFANAQTNYLLQRIESYDGVVVLASNSRARFDPAFSRRLDHILEFPLPGPEERRALWVAHLGSAHSLTARELNELALACDLCGGHIRNAVLAAAVLAIEAERKIVWDDVIAGLTLECRKLGKRLPAMLARRAVP